MGCSATVKITLEDDRGIREVVEGKRIVIEQVSRMHPADGNFDEYMEAKIYGVIDFSLKEQQPLYFRNLKVIEVESEIYDCAEELGYE